MTFRWIWIALRRESGAAAIEFALIAPVLLLMFVGMANLGVRAIEEARLNQVARETAEAALFTQSLTVLDTTLQAAITDLGAPISGDTYAGTVRLLCLCPGQAEIENCTTSQAVLCTSTGLPWEVVIEVDVQMNYQPLLPGFGTEGLIASTLRVQVR
jgi:Flp pilus assembly protein TadG